MFACGSSGKRGSCRATTAAKAAIIAQRAITAATEQHGFIGTHAPR